MKTTGSNPSSGMQTRQASHVSQKCVRRCRCCRCRCRCRCRVVWQVGAHDAEEAKTRVVNEMLAAIKGACEACVRQEKEERDGILANIQQAKVRNHVDTYCCK